MTRMLNVDLYLALGLDTVSMGIYALSYIATKQIRNVQQLVCRLPRGQFVEFNLRQMKRVALFKAGLHGQLIVQTRTRPEDRSLLIPGQRMVL